MNQQEAALFLGVSARTLRAYTQQGRVRAALSPNPGRRTLVYDPESLTALKADLERARQWRRPRPESDSTGHVGFRLDAYYLQRLTKEGEARGMSSGEYARSLVIQALESRVQDEIARLRTDFASAVYALLVSAGGQAPEAAQAWVGVTLVFREKPTLTAAC